MRQIILDTETTGLEPEQGHRIVEMACVEIQNRRITSKHLHLYVNPERDSDPDALRIHGLQTEFLAQHPKFAELADQLIDFVRGAEVIIHNASFDVKFLNAELKRAGKPRFETVCAKITDSLMVAREMFPGKRNNLDALCERFGISNAHRTLHGALLDSELLGEVWLAMTRGQDSLLVADEQDGGAGTAGATVPRFDASGLPVLQAGAEALAAHEAYLDELDKAAGKPCVWRSLGTQEAEQAPEGA